MKKMGLEGIGLKIIIPTAIYTIAALYYNTKYDFSFTLGFSSIIGMVLIAIGIIFWIWAATNLLIAYKKDVLAKTGPYKLMLNPVYMSWVLFLIPGLGFLFDSWLILSISLVLFIFTEAFIEAEYDHLIARYGDEYKKYLSEVKFKR